MPPSCGSYGSGPRPVERRFRPAATRRLKAPFQYCTTRRTARYHGARHQEHDCESWAARKLADASVRWCPRSRETCLDLDVGLHNIVVRGFQPTGRHERVSAILYVPVESDHRQSRFYLRSNTLAEATPMSSFRHLSTGGARGKRGGGCGDHKLVRWPSQSRSSLNCISVGATCSHTLSQYLPFHHTMYRDHTINLCRSMPEADILSSNRTHLQCHRLDRSQFAAAALPSGAIGDGRADSKSSFCAAVTASSLALPPRLGPARNHPRPCGSFSSLRPC